MLAVSQAYNNALISRFSLCTRSEKEELLDFVFSPRSLNANF